MALLCRVQDAKLSKEKVQFMLGLHHYQIFCRTRRRKLLLACSETNMGGSEMSSPTFLSQLHEYTVLVDRYYTPILCLLGAIGNSLSLLVFCLDSKYRSQSASYYLSALALSDTGYLLNLFAVWLESVKELVITSDFTCPLVMYLGQVTCFLSIYIIVAFSVERFRAIHYPLTRAQICTRSKARKIIAFLTVTALLLFSYAWVIAKVVQLDYYYPDDDNEEYYYATSEQYGFPQNNNVNNNTAITYNLEYHVYRCSVPKEYYQISEIANYLDTFITLIVPFLLITFFNVRISWSLWKFRDIRNEIIIGNAAASRHSNSLPTSTFSSENGSTAVTTGRKSCRSYFEGCLGKRTGKPRIEENELVEVIATSAHLKNSDRMTGDDISLSGEENINQICSVGQNLSTGCQQQQERAAVVQMSKISMTTASSEVRVAKTLLLVSSVFLLLNLPLHAVRCAQFIQSLTTSQHSPENVENTELEDEQSISSSSELKDAFLPTAQLWANMLFNTNFAVNFLLYCASGRTFRKSLQNIVRHRILRRNQPSLQTTSSTYIGGGPAAVVIANNANNRQLFRATATNEE